MEIEVQEAYPVYAKETNRFIGYSMHVFLMLPGKEEDYQIDLRHVFAQRKSKGWFIVIPFRNTLDHETKEPVRFPVYTFFKKEQHEQFMQLLRKKCIEFIEKKQQDEKIKKDAENKENKNKFKKNKDKVKNESQPKRKV